MNWTDLILVRVVERAEAVFLDGEMEGSGALYSSICTIVHSWQQLRSAEPVLRVPATPEDRFIAVDFKSSKILLATPKSSFGYERT